MSTSNCSNGVVCYNPVMKLREALDKLNRVKGLTHAEQGESESADGKEDTYIFMSTYVSRLPFS